MLIWLFVSSNRSSKNLRIKKANKEWKTWARVDAKLFENVAVGLCHFDNIKDVGVGDGV